MSAHIPLQDRYSTRVAKPKLKVGKARPKPANFTDTSFRSKAIVLNQQFVSSAASSATSQFAHHVSLLSSRTDSQRRDSLSYLTTAVSTRPTTAPLQQPVSVLLPKLLPLTLDGSNGVRTELLRLLRALPSNDVADHIEKVLPYIRAGITHLAADIRSSALDMLQWAIECSGDALVSCSGGWVKTIKTILVMQGWSTETSISAWSTGRVSLGVLGMDGKTTIKSLRAMESLLRAGLEDSQSQEDTQSSAWGWPLTHTAQHMISNRSNPYSHLNLFGTPPDEESQSYEDREDRQRVFQRKFQKAIELGVEAARQEGGEIGRAAAAVQKVIRDGIKDLEACD
ncbi:MAG: hypothetical protein LQ350_000793 [Teloschistes chrysophthalmus]|nr:MAG: hypothetical protein LQ350_000793 [Niorma chrysophthalma]